MNRPRVLIVDDDPGVLETLTLGLTRAGLAVTALSRFDEARHHIDESPPDALVVDVRLGAFNGLQLALHMRDARPAAPILVLSGFDDAMLRREAERLGAEFLTKPVSLEELGTRLREALGGMGDPPASR